MASTSESGLELFARLIPRPSLVGMDDVLFPDGPSPKDVIEVNGESSTGKTLLFTQLIAKCILPKEWKDAAVGGLDAGVVLLNTDHHFQIYKLISMMESVLKSAGGFSVSDVEDVVKSALSRLVVYNVADSVQLRVTFHALQTLLSSRPDVGLILLDSVSAFYWQDVMTAGARKIDLYVKSTVNTLQRTLGDYKGVIIYSRPDYFQSKSTSNDQHGSVSTRARGVSLKIGLKALQGNKFSADVESESARFTKTYTIDSSGIQWTQSAY